MEQQTARVRESFGFYNKNKNIFDSSEYWFENVEFPDEAVERRAELMKDDGYDEEDIEHVARDDLFEDLAYWTVYFEPQVEDIGVALECRLVPFYFKGTFYLALGACGMDLSPKLDAYQALTSGSVPRDSKIFSDEDYFAYVVGEEVMERVKERVSGD